MVSCVVVREKKAPDSTSTRSRHEVSSDTTMNYSHQTKAQLIAGCGRCRGGLPTLEGQGRGQSERDILQTIAEDFTRGSCFFSSFVRSLTSALGVRYAFVAECLDQPTTKVRTLAFWMGDHLGDNVEYEVEGTPCKETCDGEKPFYPRNIQTLFPEDRDLVTLGGGKLLWIATARRFRPSHWASGDFGRQRTDRELQRASCAENLHGPRGSGTRAEAGRGREDGRSRPTHGRHRP